MVHNFVLELHISGLFPSFYYSKKIFFLKSRNVKFKNKLNLIA
jgi:hypothetical protein